MKRQTGILCLAAVGIGVALLWSSCAASEAPCYDSYQAPIPKSPHSDDAGVYVTQEKSQFADVPDSVRRSGGRLERRGRDRDRRLFSRLREWWQQRRSERAK